MAHDLLEAFLDAVARDDLAAVEAALARQPDLVARETMLGARPVHVAHYAGASRALARLYAAGVERDGFLAAELDDVIALKAVLANDPAFVAAFDGRGMTALHGAAYWCAEAAVRMLLAAGADANAVSRDSFLVIRPLGAAVATPGVANPSDDEAKVLAVVDLLLDAGAEVNAQRRDGLTALHTAAYRGQLDVIRRLVARGADPTITGYDDGGPHAGDTPRDVALKLGQSAAAALLSELQP